MTNEPTSAIDRVLDIFRRADEPAPPFPPADMFSEGWMLRLVMDSHQNGHGGLPIPLIDRSAWYSEARLSSPFQPSRRGDPHGEGQTHADGVVGHTRMRDDTTAGLEVADDATQFVVIEAKMGSKLSAGTTRVPWYDQAARNVGAMAWTIYQSPADLASLSSLAFIVIAPMSRIAQEPTFTRYVDRGRIADKILRRIDLYKADNPKRHDQLQAFRSELLDPFLNTIDIQLVPWEQAIESATCNTAELVEFYDKCLKHNGIAE